MSTPANTEQVRFWNEIAGPHWVAAEEEIERQAGPFGEAALVVAAPAPGESVLDVGCGGGSTTVRLAEAVGPAGSVVGADLSGPMLARAEQRKAAGKLRHVHLERVDVQNADLGQERFDLAFSRFGVMFFGDPVAAFANIRRALRPGGRLAFVCWQAPRANPWMAIVNRAAMAAFAVEPPPPEAPGPFALADPQRIRTILRDAGLEQVEVAADRRRLHLGAGRTVDEWVERRLAMGAARRAYADADATHKLAVRQELVRSLSSYAVDPEDATSGLSMEAAAWLVTARRG